LHYKQKRVAFIRQLFFVYSAFLPCWRSSLYPTHAPPLQPKSGAGLVAPAANKQQLFELGFVWLKWFIG